MKRLILLVLLLFNLYSYGQKTTVNPYAETDKTALEIPDSLTKSSEDIAKYFTANFSSETDKVRAVFIWLASNIEYDVENMFAINFYEGKEEKAVKPLKTRKGICENYAALFNDICTKSGIRCFIVEGFTKQNGFTDYIPHAWNAAMIDSTWYLFDATWGSGYLNNGKFTRRINNEYFKVLPSVIIRSHMPFDYLWQFLEYPVTVQEFMDGKMTQVNKELFNYRDTIASLDEYTNLYKLERSVDRIQKNGIRNSMIFDRLQHLKLEIENYKNAHTADLYNGAVADFNDAINLYNNFIDYRNKMFKPLKPDAEIKAMVGAADSKLKEAKTKLNEIIFISNLSAGPIQQLRKAISDAEAQVKEQNDFLKLYFSKPKATRKSVFYK